MSIAEKPTSGQAFLTNRAHVLICVAQDPGARLREIADRVGITERATQRIVAELAAAGHITRQRNGRRNHYTINAHFPLPDPVAHDQNVEAPGDHDKRRFQDLGDHALTSG
jgi:predicted transcriptional regulator